MMRSIWKWIQIHILHKCPDCGGRLSEICCGRSIEEERVGYICSNCYKIWER